jgi:hypothetical protein
LEPQQAHAPGLLPGHDSLDDGGLQQRQAQEFVDRGVVQAFALGDLVTLIAALRDVIDSLCDSAWAVNRAAQSGATEVPDMKEFFQFACADRQYVMRKRQWP